MHKILIANRGEIAIRVMRGCRDMGIATVAVYSDADRAAPHVRYADEAWHIGPSQAAESYLRIDRIVDVARRSGAGAIHPGYGFLAENEDFAAACRDAGLTFIGPSAEAIQLMGSKTAARRTAIAAGAPVVPGTHTPLASTVADGELAEIAAGIGYPLLVKAVAGGGGKGMRLVADPADLARSVRAARSEAGAAFGDSDIYFERRISHARHVEIQLLADHHGTVVPFVERECSIQRRHQKVIEESPSPVMTPGLRQRMAAAAAAIARAAGYTNAGTIEFLLDEQGEFYFLEMNTRLQVEHPVTEMVTGVDLVQWQIRIARGERLTVDPQAALTPRGHAIECRIYAEDPDAGFLPSPGRILCLRAPSGPGIRRDSGVEAGFEVPIFYDSLVSKLVGWGEDRAQAIARLRRALSEYEVRGIKTTIPFFQWILATEEFAAARFHTTYLDELLVGRKGQPFVVAPETAEDVAVLAVALRSYLRARNGAAPQGRAEQPSASCGGWRRAGRMAGLRPA
ncbi:MAG: acetyl-CoA carboxylase biotin carboxylase subunit [Vicinamibacterales bacterium]|jgi:acetyl-CoA carboxylase biotin carboxylase subunit|nr:acetyl-CoA carboxylase biotin carboxylase subunit [Vicinamibacterales bacterium]